MAGIRMGEGVLRRKPIEQIEETEAGTQLERTLGLWQLTAIGVGGIIGAGIFTLAGTVANGTAGPAVLVSFLIAGFASAAAALSYAEFAGLIPKAGSAYTYGYAVLGELAGWFIGWDLLLEYTAIVAVVAIGISGYFGFLVGELGADLPAWMLGAPGTGGGHRVDLFAAILCLLIAYLLNLGIKSAARFETVVVALKVLVVLLVIGVGVFHIDTGNYHPFFPYGVGGAFTGAATVFFAVFGYDAMSTAAEESKDAQRHMPKAIIYSLAISMVLYVAACLVLTGMQNYKDIDKESGFSTAFKSVGLGGLADVIAVGAIIGILTVMFTFMLGVTRVWFSMSRDGLLPKWFAKTHPTRHVPTRVTWIVGFASAAIAGFLPIGQAAELTNIGILLAFVVVCVAVIVLRYRQPDLPRTFRTPWMPYVPALGVIFSIWLITFLQWRTWVRFGVWLVIGLVIYFGYSYKRSELAKGVNSP
ncbi:amino acid permease [Streptomyces avermitilis]|uniref:Amino acid transporter protein n=2 Tax=Streptomyces avermitilis TaxID=33903 RepID=Q825Z9_STRAW|nr:MULTISPECIES: amino acid permease [Streptomyces]KUN53376.1 amino acid permease [Streptomyces avermitilis]MYT02833.1 amino acid permease [Streptomyces sp. SID5469]OOV17956.1 amino acid permease [Streptomyces avermitilis]BAC75005.1 putative amino acid transporter protein [Streptomyces avermitilis MA-4680 = NBRC 14893]BBJ55642.1 amino acid transporter [Streptomyces avermitilis]